MAMNINSRTGAGSRPTSTQQKVLSSVMAAGVFFGIGGLLEVKSAQASVSTTATGSSAAASHSASSVKSVGYTKKTSASKVSKAPVAHATTKASKG
ncbi:unannotated protein [freshwater metagenome]|uniref:Unannotated protein n=1 Tax=freshwater metagenome TaxID=449393 RepID=A0A6J6LCA1_9ZZZZ